MSACFRVSLDVPYGCGHIDYFFCEVTACVVVKLRTSVSKQTSASKIRLDLPATSQV